MIKDPIRKRLLQMRWTAKFRGKTYPTIEQLETLIPKDLICPTCQRKMNWFRKDGDSTVLTLQHDRSGAHRIICQACNVRHAFREKDTFYETKDFKKCHRCKKMKNFSDFYADNHKRWMSRCGKCKPCTAIAQKEYVGKNREIMNAKRRVYYFRRKESGNPIPR